MYCTVRLALILFGHIGVRVLFAAGLLPVVACRSAFRADLVGLTATSDALCDWTPKTRPQ
ncbi:hypothetical protein BJV78DRAFT_1256250 [Lactifluus subvellereus]|nr:hypothetical protein BJV78DRAFT_1256250 [Lactifluus subvellereus]